MARYFFEPKDDDSIIMVDGSRSLSLTELREALKKEVRSYPIYSEENQKNMNGDISKLFMSSQETLKEAFDMEDLDSAGYVNLEGMYGSFSMLDNIPDLVQDYCAFLMFRESKDTEKLRYQIVLDHIKNETISAAPQESMSPQANEPVEEKNERNEDQDLIDEVKSIGELEQEDPNQNQDLEEANENDPIIEDEPLDGDSDPQIQDESEQPGETILPEEALGEGEGEGDEIDDEEMIDIAENCLIKVAEALLAHNVSI